MDTARRSRSSWQSWNAHVVAVVEQDTADAGIADPQAARGPAIGADAVDQPLVAALHLRCRIADDGEVLDHAPSARPDHELGARLELQDRAGPLAREVRAIGDRQLADHVVAGRDRRRADRQSIGERGGVVSDAIASGAVVDDR